MKKSTFSLKIIEKNKCVHRFEGFKTRRDAQLMSNRMYKVLATKLNHKVNLIIEKKQA